MKPTDRGTKWDLKLFCDLSKGVLLVNAKCQDLLLFDWKLRDRYL